MAQQTPSKQIYDVLVSKNFDPQLLNKEGMPAQDPSDADVFSFDWVSSSGKDYGTVVIMFGDEHDMTIYFGDNVGKSMEGDDKKEWFDFLYQLRMLAKRNLQSFSIQNLNKLKYNMKSMSTAVKEGLFESWIGTRTHSWNAKATEARLMVKHKKIIGEGDARYRYVESLFIETTEGERFKLPFTKISAGKAMLEHVKQGGKPYDARGIHITEIVNEMSVLSRFYKANKNVITEDEAEQQLIQEVAQYHANLKSQLGRMSSKRGYTNYFETWNPDVTTEQDMVIEGIRTLFATESSAHRMERALPALTKIKTQGNAMKEIGIFEGWMACLAEGTWALPDTPEKQQKLITLLSKELPVGPDATDVTEQLYDILGDDELFDQLESLAKEDANADARTIIINRLEQMASNPAVAQVIGKLKIEQKPADEPAAEQEPVQEEVSDEYGTEEEDLDEQIQRISELSSGTLKNYIKKASSSSDERSASNLASRAAHKLNDPVDQDEYDDGEADDHKSYMRSKGIARAVDKLEENENLGLFDKIVADFSQHCSFADMNPGDFAPAEVAEFVKPETKQALAQMPNAEVMQLLTAALDHVCGQFSGQINELSPSTLGGYVKKASSDRAIRNFDQGFDAGVTAHAREPNFNTDNDRRDTNRRKGIHKAVNRLTREEYQQLAELSPDTLKSYVKKASNSATNLGAQIGKKQADSDEVDRYTNRHMPNQSDERERMRSAVGAGYDDMNKVRGKAIQRNKGIGKAVDRLTREDKDIVQLDPKTGKPTSWSHEGDWEKIKKRNGKSVDARGEVANMAGRELKKAASLKEGLSIADYKKKIAAMPDAEVKSLLTVMVGHNRDNPWDQGIIKLLKRELDNRSEQLDEIGDTPQGKKALGKYVKAAASNRAMRTFDQGWDANDDIVFDKVNDRKQAKRGMGISRAVDRLVREDEETSPVESAILRRIMGAHLDLLEKYGPEAVMDAARGEADFVGDVDEIGSSDVSGWVKNVIWGLEKSAEYLKSRKVDEDADDMTDMTKWMDKYDEREDHNAHTENALAVAKLVGDADDVKLIKAIQNRHEMRGHISEPDYQARYEVHKRLWPLVQKKAADWNQRVNDSIKPNGELAREGMIGKVAGSVAGSALGGPVGSAIGGMAGDALQDKFFEGTALQGQYGHAGKMAPVKAEQFGDKFAEDIARLKALALIK